MAGIRSPSLWEKHSGPAQQVYLAHSSSRREAKIRRTERTGLWSEDELLVVPHSGLKYSAIWEKVDGGWELRSSLTPDEYRREGG